MWIKHKTIKSTAYRVKVDKTQTNRDIVISFNSTFDLKTKTVSDQHDRQDF